jgi:hypothetical protein
MRAAALAFLSSIVLACSLQGPSGAVKPPVRPSPTGSSPTPSPTPTTAPAAEPFGVLGTSGIGQPGYQLSIVRGDGKVVGTAAAAPRSGLQCIPAAGPILPFPSVSISNSRVYYLDGNTAVKYLTPDGSLGVATSVPGNGSIGSTFAVSADDKRIAVVATDYSKQPLSYRIYVEDVAGGGNHVDVFSSTGSVPWAMGWRSGLLVLGITAGCTQGGGPFSSFPWEYHVVDATNANRSATLGSPNGCRIASLPVPAGALCQDSSGSASLVDWEGKIQRAIGLGTGQYYNFALAPSGSAAAACCEAAGNPVLGSQTSPLVHVPGGGDSLGFIDDLHLLIGAVAVQSQSRVYNVTTGSSTPVSALGFFVGRLPGGFGT